MKISEHGIGVQWPTCWVSIFSITMKKERGKNREERGKRGKKKAREEWGKKEGKWKERGGNAQEGSRQLSKWRVSSMN